MTESVAVPARADGRQPDQLRPVRFTPDFQPYAEGSVLIECGDTRVICSVSVEEKVPAFLKGMGRGWVTAEYSMLPRSTTTRTNREVQSGRPSGRTQENQRLIGRSLRAAVDLDLLGERTMTVDCDVLQADAGTRTASITGAYVALHVACQRLLTAGKLATFPLSTAVAAVSVGIVDGTPCLDLCYVEDRDAEVDFNVVMTSEPAFVEMQGTAEHKPFTRQDSGKLLDLAEAGIAQLFELQRQAIAGWPDRPVA